MLSLTYNMLEDKLKKVFISKYKKSPDLLIKAPGRINIIGEHTDYNLGYVLPAAIDHYMYLGISKNNSNQLNVFSMDYADCFSISLHDIEPCNVSWLNLICGVIDQLKDDISGFDLVFCGDIPEGAGLSSSAALCCGTAYGLSKLFELNLGKWDIAKIAQKAEHTFAHVQCGIMDQFACMFGLTNHVLLLDCQSLEFEESEIDMAGYKFVLLDSNVKHELNESDYNSRRYESAFAMEKLREIDSSIKTFKEVSLEFIESIKSDDVWWKRGYHIVTENIRVKTIYSCLRENKMEEVGQLINEGHKSQKEYYEITCPETDFLVEELNNEPSVFGARQVGGGFGGCILSIAKDNGISDMINDINNKYQKEFGKKTTEIPIKLSKGCHLIE